MSLKAKIEALLFLTTDPLTAPQIAMQANADINDVRSALSQLIQEYESRFDSGITIDTSRGYTMVVQEEYENLTQDILPLEIKTGCLRTLSVIALKEPVYQSELVKMRGGGAYEHIKELLEMNLIKKKKESNSYMLSTTALFDEFFKMTDDGLELQHLLQDTNKHITFSRGGDSLEEALEDEDTTTEAYNESHDAGSDGAVVSSENTELKEESLKASIEKLENNQPLIEHAAIEANAEATVAQTKTEETLDAEEQENTNVETTEAQDIEQEESSTSESETLFAEKEELETRADAATI